MPSRLIDGTLIAQQTKQEVSERVRWDKRIEDADRLSRVAELYDSVANTARQDAPPPPPAPEPTLFD